MIEVSPRRRHSSDLNSQFSNTSSDNRKTMDDFEKLPNRELGRGSYSRVHLVREKTSGSYFAMKEMSKAFFWEQNLVENLKREIKIHRKLNHPHITRLCHYFEDKKNVYLILEYCENGSLFRYVRKRKSLSESEAFVYFFQTALGIDYLHKNNIIHRDLKPENLLLDSKGNIKVCDFGWSADSQNSSNRITFCGTLEYMAPEMLKGQVYTKSVDMWSLGILLFELINGRSPYQGGDTKRKILRGAEIVFDKSMSPESVDLVKRLLVADSSRRMTMDELFTHPWMMINEKTHNIKISSYIYRLTGGSDATTNTSGGRIVNMYDKADSLVDIGREFSFPHGIKSSSEVPGYGFMEPLGNSGFDGFKDMGNTEGLKKSYGAWSAGRNFETEFQDFDFGYMNHRDTEKKEPEKKEKEGSFISRILEKIGCLSREKPEYDFASTK